MWQDHYLWQSWNNYSSAAFRDVGLLTKHNTSRAFDRGKLRRHRAKFWSDSRQVQTDHKVTPLQRHWWMQGQNICSRKSRHKVLSQNCHWKTSSYRRIYLDILETFRFGIEYSIVDVIATNNRDTSKLVSVRCGGTAVNSDMRGGVIRLIGEYGGEGPLQWMFCQLHCSISMDTP